MIKAVFLDISGVLISGTKAIPGAVAAFNRLLQSPVHVRLVTNSSRESTTTILNKLSQLGFSATRQQFYSAAIAARDYIQKNQLRPYCLMSPALREDFDDIPTHSPNAVFIADAESAFNYKNLNQAFRLCIQGCPLIAIGDNKYFREGGELHLDAGPFIKAIEYASGQPATFCGKPSEKFFQQVLGSLDSQNIQADEVLMIGDDVTADVEGAMATGLNGCLVKTGKYSNGDERQLPRKAWVANSVAEAVQGVLAQALEN